MSGPRRWWWRAALAVAVYGVALVVTTVLRDDPDPLRLALLVAAVVAAGALLLDASWVPSAAWPLDPPSTTGLGRADPRTATYVRMLESHLTAGSVDATLRDRLRELADRALRTRRELSVDDPRAEDVLGPELLAALTGPPRRLTLPQVDRVVSRIEAL